MEEPKTSNLADLAEKLGEVEKRKIDPAMLAYMSEQSSDKDMLQDAEGGWVNLQTTEPPKDIKKNLIELIREWWQKLKK